MFLASLDQKHEPCLSDFEDPVILVRKIHFEHNFNLWIFQQLQLQLDWCCRLIPSTIWIWNSWCFMRGRGIRETWFPRLYSPGERQFLGKDVEGFLISFLLVCMCTTKTTDRRICCDSRAAGWRTSSLCVAMKLRVQSNSVSCPKTKTSIWTSGKRS